MDPPRHRSIAMPPYRAVLLRTAMKEGLFGATLGVSSRSESNEARLRVACWTGSESSQGRRLAAVERGGIVDEWASPPDADGLRGLAAWAAMWAPAVRGVIESMNGARLVHDGLEERGWEGLIADATKVKGAGAAGVQDRQGRRARAGHPGGRVTWCRRSGCRTRAFAASASSRGCGCTSCATARR